MVQIIRDTALSLVGITVLLRQLLYAIKTQLKAPKENFLPFLCLYGMLSVASISMNGSIIGAGVSNIMIPPKIDSVCAHLSHENPGPQQCLPLYRESLASTDR